MEVRGETFLGLQSDPLIGFLFFHLHLHLHLHLDLHLP